MKETLRAAFVIGRRDFTAIIFSKAFFFFLLGPLFPLVVALIAGNLGKELAENRDTPVIGVMMDAQQSEKIMRARETLSKEMGPNYFAEMKCVEIEKLDALPEPQSLLTNSDVNYAVILSGTLEKPVLTGTDGSLNRQKASIALLSGYASNEQSTILPDLGQLHVSKVRHISFPCLLYRKWLVYLERLPAHVLSC